MNLFMKQLSIKIKELLLGNKSFFLTFGILFVTYTTWWLAFFPGIMTSDSFDQWLGAITFKFSNGSPYLYALIMSLLRVFDNTPAPMGMLQLLLFSVIIALFINYARKKGINIIVIFLTVIFFVIWPQFGIYNVTIWKDVMYSVVTLGLGLMSFVYVSDQKVRDKPWSLYCIVIFSALVALFRFNGIIFLFVPSILFLILRTIDYKKAAKMTVLTVLLYALFANLLLGILGVRQAPAMADGLMVKAVGGIYSLKNPNLSEFERMSFEALDTETDWKKYYSCYSVNALIIDIMKDNGSDPYSPYLSPDPVVNANWHKAFWSAMLKNPLGYLKDRACQADNLLGIRKVNNFRYADKIYRSDWQPLVVEDSKLPAARDWLREYLIWSVDGKHQSDIFWGTWLLLIFNLVAIVWSMFKRMPGLFTFTAFTLANLLLVGMSVPAIDYRYVYFVAVCTPFIPILYLIEKSISKNRK
jgi:hypothetical protein